MPYTIEITPRAKKQITGLATDDRKRVGKKIDALARDPRPSGAKKLHGDEGFYRIRMGDYRIIYAIHEHALLVLVVRIGNRREVYR